ncbi:winged helix-turn-helix transcriptional regulator [Arcicella rigui]|uniref:Helix-turn-helix domain-containing protein n=1 Tax=Arcicella rigui TaxID=797020 RepID=A0ABU5QA34_9BACT|nr:helix-turn-helix domain-containing protein [Arcicella rigui]MEA5139447.1 helix-turn-helix domain-containing protein [Arcicella rigui]
MTTTKEILNTDTCPIEGFLKMLSGKWKLQIFRLAVDGPLRFNSIVRTIEESNKQSVAVALREMEKEGLLEKIVVNLKPLHIEYVLSEKGKSLIPIFHQIEKLS